MTAPTDRVARPVLREGGQRTLLVMLHGANDVPESFVRHGFIEALDLHRFPVDVVLADVHQDGYLDARIQGLLAARLEREIVAPARRRGYPRIWFLGVSLGGMGSLIYARAHPGALEGIILLAPYLASTGTVAALHRSGGLVDWEPAADLCADDDRALLGWLRNAIGRPGVGPRLFLGYGNADRFAQQALLVAPLLPKNQVVTVDGGHDWPTWSRLWSGILALRPFTP